MPVFTSFITAGITAGVSGGAVLAVSEISGDTYMPIKAAWAIAIMLVTVILWLDRQFFKVRTMIGKRDARDKLHRQWVSTSIHLINRRLHLDGLKEPDEKEPSTT
jgi:membrane-bound ClpP family serine protease